MSHSPLVLIPCAGRGTRVGQPQAKEMLIENETQQPLIFASLDLCLKYQWPAHIITRVEKTNLIDYARNFAQQNQLTISIQTISDSKEWPDTLLQSEKFWCSQNLVLLPDTRWQPEDITKILIDTLQTHDFGYATFQPSDFQKWGFVKIHNESCEIYEKPSALPDDFKAWGLFSFRKNFGRKLLQAHLDSQIQKCSQKISGKGIAFNLESFKDLTRGE